MNKSKSNCYSSFSQDCIEPVEPLIKLLAEANRLKILCLLTRQPHCVCELESQLKLSQSLISHHLSDLKEMGLADSQRDGQRVYYNLTERGLTVINLLEEMRQVIEEDPSTANTTRNSTANTTANTNINSKTATNN